MRSSSVRSLLATALCQLALPRAHAQSCDGGPCSLDQGGVYAVIADDESVGCLRGLRSYVYCCNSLLHVILNLKWMNWNLLVSSISVDSTQGVEFTKEMLCYYICMIFDYDHAVSKLLILALCCCTYGAIASWITRSSWIPWVRWNLNLRIYVLLHCVQGRFSHLYDQYVDKWTVFEVLYCCVHFHWNDFYLWKIGFIKLIVLLEPIEVLSSSYHWKNACNDGPFLSLWIFTCSLFSVSSMKCFSQ